jgi:hypothetical protein
MNKLYDILELQKMSLNEIRILASNKGINFTAKGKQELIYEILDLQQSKITPSN